MYQAYDTADVLCRLLFAIIAIVAVALSAYAMQKSV